MKVDVTVPVLAESVSEATLMTWHKQQGETVKRGDNLIDIETDKVTLEIAALSDGVLIEILKGNGESVNSDEIIARIESQSAAEKPVEQKSTPKNKQQPLSAEEMKSSKSKLSPAVRNLLNEHRLDTNEVPIRSTDGRMTKEDVINYLNTQEPSQPSVLKEPRTFSEPQLIKVAESKPVAKLEIESVQKQVPVPAMKLPANQGTKEVDESSTDGGRTERRVAMTRLRQRAAERLLSAQHENAILTTFNEVNMKPVIGLRKQYKDQFEKEYGVKLGFMSFFTRATTEALKKFPVINASIDAKDIVYHGYFDIGIAVSTPRGLVVPIIRDTDTLSLAKIESKIAEYGQKARDSKLTIEELTGGTFTITNGGIFGSLLSTPIINPPQSAILGMHKIQERPMAVNGDMMILPMMYLALSYDHRIIDGKEAVQFLATIKDMLEDPARLLLQI